MTAHIKLSYSELNHIPYVADVGSKLQYYQLFVSPLFSDLTHRPFRPLRTLFQLLHIPRFFVVNGYHTQRWNCTVTLEKISASKYCTTCLAQLLVT